MTDLTGALLEAETRLEMEAFLDALLSPSELTKLRRRVELFRRVLTTDPHRTIAAELSVGIATVTRAAAAVRLHDQIVKTILGRASQKAHEDDAC